MGTEMMYVQKCICERCGHDWVQRGESKPIACPSCKSPYWNRKRKNLSNKVHGK